MDQTMRPTDADTIETADRKVSRRTFLSWTRVSLMAAAGVAVFGVGSPIASTVAKESSDEDSKEKEKDSKEKDSKEKPRDKDQDAKEKEKESDAKAEKKSKQGKQASNSSNTKKKKKKNGDDPNKKKSDPSAAVAAAPASPYAKYVVEGKDRYGCTDIPTQADAQAVLRLSPKDPNNLDGNANGIACDGNDAFMDGVAFGIMAPPYDFTPVTRPAQTTKK